jgi:hypothetical protein
VDVPPPKEPNEGASVKLNKLDVMLGEDPTFLGVPFLIELSFKEISGNTLFLISSESHGCTMSFST